MSVTSPINSITSPVKAPRHTIFPPKTPLKSPNGLGRFPTTPKPAEEDLSRLEPDQMFARFSVAEVRALQARLRNDADSKQEELRLMVGERYRDLLQASTAIVSISETSQRVRSVLQEIKESCDTRAEVRTVQSGGHRRTHSIIHGPKGKTAVQDSQLVSLQSLAAHLKLLLDTPEQLWRLLERKRYLQAAWLFLLARVVHRALTQDDDEDEHDVAWSKAGIEVSEQFPLIQRQWDTISSFRSQISYRASQSLREFPSSSSNPKATYLSSAETLVSILLLDSLPLAETLALFLSQRTKTLQTVYSSHRADQQPPSISKSRRKNQEVAASLLRSPNPSSNILTPEPSADLNSVFRLPSPFNGDASGSEAMESRIAKRQKGRALKQVRQSLKRAVDIVTLTLGATRHIYGGSDSGALIQELLDHAAGTSVAADPSHIVDTPSLLKSLPSSTLLVRYLPPSIQSYAPFIDTTSSSSQLSPSTISKKCSAWFSSSLAGLGSRLSEWLEELKDVHEVWSVWTGLQVKHAGDNGVAWMDIVSKDEKQGILDLVQQSCIKRVKEVWKEKLSDIEGALVTEAERCIAVLRKGEKDSEADINPSTFYFGADALNSLTGAEQSLSTSTSSAPRKCKDALKQRVKNRTPLLHSVLTRIEKLAEDLRRDLGALTDPDEELIASYRSEALASALAMAKSLQNLASPGADVSSSTEEIRVAVFVGKLALELGAESSFIGDLLPGVDDNSAFREEMTSAHEASLDRWRAHSVAVAMDHCMHIFEKPTLPPTSIVTPSYPSSHLSQGLLSLACSVQELGFISKAVSSGQTSQQLLNSFATALAKRVPEDLTGLPLQAYWDMSFVAKLANQSSSGEHHEELSSTVERLQSTLSSIPTSKGALANMKTSLELQISRTQLLFGLLVPPTSATPSAGLASPAPARARSGTLVNNASVPPAEKDFQLAIDLAKPASRFGMLLIANTSLTRS